MKSKFTLIWATLLVLTQACLPLNKALSSPTQNSTNPPATGTPQTDSSGPLVETVLPQTSATAETTPLSAEGITLQDNNGTFMMKVGDSFLLNLGADIYDWTVAVDNENVLRMKMGVLVIQGAQGIYEALTPGTATLTATGNPRCLQSNPPCGMPSILFRLTVTVE